MNCELCGSSDHTMEFHDTEILNWLSADPHEGNTTGRAYYVYKRRDKIGYKGLRKDVWAMMHSEVYTW